MLKLLVEQIVSAQIISWNNDIIIVHDDFVFVISFKLLFNVRLNPSPVYYIFYNLNHNILYICSFNGLIVSL